METEVLLQATRECDQGLVEKHHPGGGDARYLQDDQDMCRTYVLTPYAKNSYSYISRITCCWMIDKDGERKSMSFGTYYLESRKTYKAPTKSSSDTADSNQHLNRRIREICRATTAAPTYFEAVKMERFDHAKFTDGGFPGYNNPTQVAYQSITRMSGKKRNMKLSLVSIGTGKKKSQQRNAWWAKGPLEIYALIQSSLDFATDCEPTHETVSDLINGSSEYFRLNVGEEIGNMALDDWRGQHGQDTLDQLRGATQRYLGLPKTQKDIAKIAESLVHIRRARAHDEKSDFWETYCHGVYYRCDEDGCDKQTIHYARTDFSNHLKLVHRFAEEKIQEELDLKRHQPECFE